MFSPFALKEAPDLFEGDIEAFEKKAINWLHGKKQLDPFKNLLF